MAIQEVKGITQRFLKEQLHYEPTTGVFTWRVTRGSMCKEGEVAGSLDASGYRRITIVYKICPIHRLAFLYMVGVVPKQVDHKNGDRADNRWVNLREATALENSHNSSLAVTSTSGIKGIHINYADNRVMGQVVYKGKKHRFSKSFGSWSDRTLEEALPIVADWVQETRTRLHKEYACHG